MKKMSMMEIIGERIIYIAKANRNNKKNEPEMFYPDEEISFDE